MQFISKSCNWYLQEISKSYTKINFHIKYIQILQGKHISKQPL